MAISFDEAVNLNKNILWVRHAESCANIRGLDKTSHPSLTNFGINQAILLGMNFINNLPANRLTIGYTSPLARTVMTALLSMRTYSYSINPNFEIIPNQYISEVLNMAGAYDYDYQNKILSPLKLKLMIELIKDWLENFWLIEYDDYEFNKLIKNIEESVINDLQLRLDVGNCLDTIRTMRFALSKDISQNKNINHVRFRHDIIGQISLLVKLTYNKDLCKFTDSKFLRGPRINLSSYNDVRFNEIIEPSYYTRNLLQLKWFPPIHKFYNIDSLENIICFSHGSILKHNFKELLSTLNRELFDIHDNFKNTAVILETNNKLCSVYPINNKEYNELNNGYNIKVLDICKIDKLDHAIKTIANFSDDILSTPESNVVKSIFSFVNPFTYLSKSEPKSSKFKVISDNTLPIGILTQNYTDELMSQNIARLNGKSIFLKKYNNTEKNINNYFNDQDYLKYIKYKNKYLSLKNKLAP